MGKTIRKTIQITTRKRHNGVKINDEFYSYDKNNAQFEFIMDYDVPADKVIALFHFEQTNRYYETLCQFKGNRITIEFDTSLIVEDELVTGYLYFDKLEKSTDVYRFTFGARLSEIDKTRELPVQEKVSRRIVPVADIVTKQELEELMEKIKKNGGTYDDTEIRNSISSISERVQTLENKPDNDTRYDDSDVKSRLNVLETNASRYLTEHQPLTSVEERIQQVEARFNNLSNIYLSSHQSLEHLATKDALDKIEQRVEQLESKPEIDVTNFATNSKVTAVESRVLALENKQVVTQEELEAKHYLTNVPEEYAKKSELYNDSALTERVSLLEAKAIANGAYNDKPLLDKIQAIEEQFRNASNLYLQSHQSLEHLVTKKELEDKHYLTSVPEEVTNQISALENKVQTLENKSVVTHEELESAGYAKTSDLTNLAANSKVEAVESRVLALENKPTIDTNEFAKKSEIPQGYDDSALSGRVSALEAKQDKDTIYNDEEIKRRLTTLEGKTDNFITGVSVNKEGSNVTLTYNYVDGQTKNVSFTDSDTVNVAYDDSGLKQRITNLENRPQVDLTDYAKKSEIPQAYNDNELSRRVSVLEAKEDKDTIYNDEEIKRRLATLEGKPTVDVSEFAKKTEVPTIDSVNNLLRTQGEQLVKINALEAKSGYEIHGTGMPNGKVTAQIGTTYVDMAVTNGALKWIKRTGDGNTGWQVLTGDTGWRTLPLINKRGNAKLQVRRINDQVIVKFDGLSWGWFGVDDIDKQEKAGNIVDKNIGGKKYTWINLNIGRGSNVLSVGFRSASSTLAGLYGNLGDLLGSVYVGGTADQNAIQLRYAMPKSELNNTILSQIRISPVTFITDDDWPTTLP